MQRQILKPQIDVPLVLRLDRGPDGKETQSLRGDLQYQYTCNDDRAIIWLPPEARAVLMRTGAQPGDHVQLVKSLRGRNAIWNAEVLPDGDVQPEPPSRMVAPRAAYQAPRQMPTPARTAAASDSITRSYTVSRSYDEAMNGRAGNGQPPPDPKPRPAEPAVPAPSRMGEVMQRALEISARANWSAYQAARAAGCELDAPTWEDVRAAGISMFIEYHKNGGSR